MICDGAAVAESSNKCLRQTTSGCRSSMALGRTPGATVAATAPITDANPSVAEMESPVARFRDLRPTADYVDSMIPGVRAQPMGSLLGT